MEIETPQLLKPDYYLVSYTQPAEDMTKKGINTPLDLIAYCARVSNPENQTNSETAERLLNYLIRNQHWSPLQMVDVTIGITTARDISRQILRHRSAEFQEFSQRYADVEGDRHCLRELRLEHPTNRQSSIEVDDPELLAQWMDKQLMVLAAARDAYEWARKHKIAKECARVVLPEGLTLTDLYMKASLRTWIHYIGLRKGNGTQKEHAGLAIALAQAIAKVFPVEIAGVDHA